MTDLYTRKEGRSIRRYWSPGSIRGQRIYNAEATSQQPPIASWCENSAFKACKKYVSVHCVYFTQREKKSELCLEHLHRFTVYLNILFLLSEACEHSRVCFTVSKVYDSPPLWAHHGSITAKQIYCADGTLGWGTCSLPGIIGLSGIYTFR